MQISKLRSYMDIRQIFVLSSILCKAIFSVYPRLGGPNVRSDPLGLSEPRSIITGMSREMTLSLRDDDMFVVMWASTLDDINLRHRIPNHFVPAVAHIHSRAVCIQASVCLTSNDLHMPNICDESISKEI